MKRSQDLASHLTLTAFTWQQKQKPPVFEGIYRSMISNYCSPWQGASSFFIQNSIMPVGGETISRVSRQSVAQLFLFLVITEAASILDGSILTDGGPLAVQKPGQERLAKSGVRDSGF